MHIIIPVYKNIPGLVATLLLLNQQTETPDLVTVINTSGEPEVDSATKMFAGAYNLRQIFSPHTTVYEAWNKGLAELHGLNWIINDDTLFPRQAISIIKQIRREHLDAYAFVPDTPARDFHTDSYPQDFKFDCTIAVDEVKPTDWLVGFSYVLTDQCVKALGLFDTSYRCWYGDSAMEREIQLSGHPILKIHGLNVFHYGGKSYEYQAPEVKKMIDADRLTFTQKYPIINSAKAV